MVDTLFLHYSGYDFGYLLKLLTDQNLPSEESEFFELLRLYFPSIYDVKVSTFQDFIRSVKTLFVLSFKEGLFTMHDH